MAFTRYYRSAYRKGKRLYNYAKKNPRKTAAMARTAFYMAKRLRGIINSEKMYLDTSALLGAAQSSITSLNALANGDTTGTRTGNSILCKSLYFRGYMNINSSTTVSTRVSIALVQDLQQISDTNPGVLDIFTSQNPEAQLRTGATTNTAGRFKILWRKNYILVPSQRPTVTLDKFRKLNTHVKFNGSGTGDIQKNGLYLVFLTSEATNYPTINITSRLAYYDN